MFPAVTKLLRVMPESSFFSIIIPTYNRAHLIGKTIASVLAQRERDFEVIVVDDGSTDPTEEAVRCFRDERVQYHRKNNGERAAARNYGAKLARGEYVNFVDSDDLLCADHLTEAKRVIALHQRPEIFHLQYEIVNDEGRRLFPLRTIQGDLNDQLLKGNLLSCDGVFLRRDVALEYPFNEDRRLSASEDWELWLRLASRFPIYYSNKVTSQIVQHDERSVMSVDEAALIERKNLTLKYLSEDEAFMKKYGDRRNLIEGEFLSYTALHLALAGYPGRACKHIKESLLANPATLFQRRFLAVVKHIIINSLRKSPILSGRRV